MMSARSTPNLSQAVHHSGNTVKSSNNFTHHHHQQQLTASFNEKLSPNHSGTIYPHHLHQAPTDGIHHTVNNTNEEKTTNSNHNTTLYPHHLHHQPANVSITEGTRLGQSEEKINSSHNTSIYPHHVHHTAPGVNTVSGGFHADVKHSSHTTSIYSYLHNQSGLNFAPVSAGSSVQISSSSTAQPQVPTSAVPVNDDLGSESPPSGSPPPTPPVRDASSLKSVKYGPGHEKYPSWPVAAAADAPQALRGPPSGGSHRSKSWTDHTNYPKEKVIAYTRPYMKRPNSAAFSQQKLKTVMERCEKIPPETYESRHTELNDIYLPRMDREGKAFGDHDYMVPSPPERDVSKPQLNQQELEEYARSYQDQSFHQTQLQHLTQADLEEYTRSYEEALSNQHQKQASYAQSEGYHSYVSSTDSMSTPFLDRLRRDSEAVTVRSNEGTWDEQPERERDGIRHEGRDSVVTTSSGSASSSETLKWHGSMSDVSVASSSCTHLGSNANSRQLIAHSARVQTPQRHNSESVLYIGPPAVEQKNQQDEWKERENRNNHHNKLRLFPVNTYTVQPEETVNSQTQSQHRHGPQSPSQTTLSVADRISELERQQTRYTYLDPEKRHRVSDPTLKAIQKKALLSFYERHQATTTKNQSWRSEPQLAQQMPAKPQSPPPQPPPRPRGHPTSRRASSASDYAKSGQWRENIAAKQESIKELKDEPRHQHSNSCGSLSNDLLGPVIMGPSISIDDWVPERPPKNPHLRTAFPDLFQEQRIPSPDLPPPSPPMVLENEVFNNDEPFPPPPAELDVSTEWQRTLDRLKDEEAVENIRKKSEQQQSTHIRQSSDQLHSNLNISTHVRKNSEQSLEMRVLHNSEQAKMNSPDSKHQHPEIKPRQSPPKTLPLKKHTFQSEFCNMAMPQVRHSISGRNIDIRLSQRHRPNSVLANSPQNHMQKALYSPTADESLNHKLVNHFVRSSSYDKDRNSEQTVGFAAHRQIPTERASMRHPSTQKLLVNGRVSIAVSQKIQPSGISGQFRAEPLRAHHLYNNENKRPLLTSAMSEDETLTRNHQRASFAGTERSIFTTNDKSSLMQSQPPPLQPRQARTNQSMRLKHEDPTRFSQAGIVRTSMSGSVEKTGADENRTLNQTTSQSKASYLASYRRGERNQPTDSDRGSYKRTMSPGGHALEPSPPDDNKWPPTITNHRHGLIPKDIEKDPMVITNNNNNSLLHRLSLENKKYAESTKETKLDVVLKKHNEKDFNSTCNNLPDVLPVSAKLSPPRTLSISQNGLNHLPTKTSPVLYNAPSPLSTLPRSPLNNYSINSPPKIASPRRLSKGSPIDLSPGSPKRLINDIDISPTIDNRTNSIKSSPKGSPPTMSPERELMKSSSEREIIKSSNRILQRVPSKKESPVALPTRVSPEKIINHISEKTSSCEGLNKLEDISNQIQKDSIKRFTPELNRSQSVPEVFSKEMSLAEERKSPEKGTVSETPPKSPQTSPPHSPEVVRKNPSPPTVVEGLQLIQRTEVVLHVNACTTMDAASQTDLKEDVEVSEVATMVRTTPVPMRRQKLQEEIECERLSRDLANQLSPTDRLKGLLMPAPEHKKPTDYVSGLFKPEVTSRSRSSKSFRLTQTVSTSTSPPESPSSKTPPQQNGFPREISPTSKDSSSPLSATSTYFTTSESKAKFLTRYSRDMSQYNGIQDTKDLNQKKEELMNRLDRKLEVLRSEQLVVSEDSRINESLGEQVNSHVSRLARPQEVAKYRLHVEEVGKITSLLLGLSGRLARVENALMGLESDHAERKILETKRDKLKEQLEEAKKLKENIDRRSVSVSNILYKYLNSEEYADYDHFINMKAKLIMDSREIADKIKLGEEQLTALRETLIVPPTN